MAKQTFTTGQVLTAAQMTSLQQTAMGGGSPSTKTASYVLVAADAGTVIQMNAAGSTTITVNTALFSAGDSVQIQNIGAGVCTVTAGTATVNTSGSLALSQWEGGFLYFTSASSAIFFDVVQSSGMTNPMTTAGDTIYGGASGTPTRLAIGSTGQVLTVSGGNPVWATPAGGGGKVLQVVSTAKTDSFSTATAAFTDVTGLSVSITPSATTSKVLVMVTLSASARDGQGDSGMRLLRGATDIAIGDAAGSRTRVSQDIILTNVNAAKSINLVFLDSPSTTSSTTYKIQVAGLAPSSGWTTYVNRSYDDTDAANRSRSVSTITVLEIGA